MRYKIAIVGEAYGADEDRYKKPFIGASGRLLNEMLEHAGLNRNECYVTNCFNLRPPGNDIKALCTSKKDLPKDYPWPALQQGHYIRQEYAPEVARLRRELEELRPNLIIALGNTACWALMGKTGIKALRGAIAPCVLVPGLKVLPSWHPAAVMREWSLRPSAVLDLMKAKREAEYPEIRSPNCELILAPTLLDMETFWRTDLVNATSISVDIENPNETISCIGFAPSPNRCLVVPFEDETQPGWNYWPSIYAEKAAWQWVRKVLLSPIPKIGQNFGAYDVLHLWREYGLRVNNMVDDTMLLHHSLQPEEMKSLGFLGTIYTNHPSWKQMRTRGKKEIKRDA